MALLSCSRLRPRVTNLSFHVPAGREKPKMLTRREILIGTGLAGIAATFARTTSSAFASAAQPSTPVNFKVPDGACDCHAHIFGDPQKYPFAIPRSYTPEIASVDEMQALHRTLHIPRVVIVET